jgi:flagellar protein FliS
MEVLMKSAEMMRQRFRDDAVATASNERVVVMAFDRIDRDLAEALDALSRGDVSPAHGALCHAQALLCELQMMLDVKAWEHAPKLLAIYEYLITRLIHANITKTLAPVEEVRRLAAELGDAFRTAALAPAMPVAVAGR